MSKSTTMKKINLLMIALILGAGMSLKAQEEFKEADREDSTEEAQQTSEIIRPLHISLITPLSTNGMQSGEITNIFSLNMIAGYSGGLMGLELGGFSNVIKGETRGVQLAGFSNTGMGDIVGMQGAGFANVGLGKASGLQLAGFSNVVKDELRGMQGSGFHNNAADIPLGAQFAGFSNVALGNVNGVQVAGFMNVAKDSLQGAQFAGFSNAAEAMPMGAQFAGFANVTKGDIHGAQVAGFMNRARKVNGAQIAPFNFADSIESGVSIGVLSFVKHGYRALEISANETFYGNVSFKTGVEKFYNILTIGASARKNEIIWAWGYGLGTTMPVTEKMKVNIEAVSYHVNEDVWFTSRLNSLNKLNATVEYEVGDFLTVYGGPTWNVHVSQEYYVEGVPTTSSLVGWNTFDRTKNAVNVKMYPGFTVGIRL